MASTSPLRDAYAQRKYREQSKAEDSDNKHVAHYFSLEIAAFINKYAGISNETLKFLCNDANNLRMVQANTNLSSHKLIDKKLIKSFEMVILPTVNADKTCRMLLQKNPTQLDEMLNIELIEPIRLDWNEAQRAKAQCKRVQKLPFPQHYRAFVRLFYRRFVDGKNRKLWHDSGNTKEFDVYLQRQRLQVKQNCADEKEIDGEPKKENNQVKAVKLTESESIIVSPDRIYGEDNKGRMLYIGKKGGIFYWNKSGNKTYVTKKFKNV
mmetsp:Transcript_34123/g.55627  ORF Transcript_34123/g.55627 Transcript_34123/m.55627 type:complete len:266 (-) Transcript_34123:68-865(-)